MFYDLPFDLCDQFIIRYVELTKENLTYFLTYSDFVIQGLFNQINARTNNVRLNDANDSGQRGDSQSMPGASFGPRSVVDLNESQLFLNLDSDVEDNEEIPDEIDNEMLLDMDLPIREPPGNQNRAAENRDNPDGEVPAKRGVAKEKPKMNQNGRISQTDR